MNSVLKNDELVVSCRVVSCASTSICACEYVRRLGDDTDGACIIFLSLGKYKRDCPYTDRLHAPTMVLQKFSGDLNVISFFDASTSSPFAVFLFGIEFIIQALIGLVFGAAIDRGFIEANVVFLGYSDVESMRRAKDDENADSEERARDRIILFLSGILQLVVNVLVVFLLTKFLPYNLHGHWQNSIGGMAFSALFYGVQQNLFDSIGGLIRR